MTTIVETFRDVSVAVFGLGGSGLSAVRALRAGGAKVSAWDDSESARANAIREHYELVDLTTADWRAFQFLILAPGVPLTHPEPHWTVKRAQENGIPVIGDIELFCRERAARAPHAPFIAITGTNGKSTTTALIAHILKEAGHDVALGGNIGTAVLDLPPPDQSRVHVLECSSFQIDLTPSLHPTIGILLNVTPDHLDRHGTMSHYASVKERLIQGADQAVIGIDDEWCRAIYDRRCQNRGEVTAVTLDPRAVTRLDIFSTYVEGRKIFMTTSDGVHEMVDLSGIMPLRGAHNAQNAAAAIAALTRFGLSHASIEKGLRSFGGLPHRLECIGTVGRVEVINDSKATNADATEKALASFESGLFWILGGRAKEGGITHLAPYFDRIEKAYLIGEAATSFAVTLIGQVAFETCQTLDAALAAAIRDSAASRNAHPVILLSPACASYDQFKNFEERGDVFRALVSQQPEFKPKAGKGE